MVTITRETGAAAVASFRSAIIPEEVNLLPRDVITQLYPYYTIYSLLELRLSQEPFIQSPRATRLVLLTTHLQSIIQDDSKALLRLSTLLKEAGAVEGNPLITLSKAVAVHNEKWNKSIKHGSKKPEFCSMHSIIELDYRSVLSFFSVMAEANERESVLFQTFEGTLWAFLLEDILFWERPLPTQELNKSIAAANTLLESLNEGLLTNTAN